MANPPSIILLAYPLTSPQTHPFGSDSLHPLTYLTRLKNPTLKNHLTVSNQMMTMLMLDPTV